MRHCDISYLELFLETVDKFGMFCPCKGNNTRPIIEGHDKVQQFNSPIMRLEQFNKFVIIMQRKPP